MERCRTPFRAAIALAAAFGAASMATASSHREAPFITRDPPADNTDVYAFLSRDMPGTVTLIANYVPAEEPAGGPNFFSFGDDVAYEIRIDNDGDGAEDIVFRFEFRTTIQNPASSLYNTGPIASLTDPDWNVRQLYDLTRFDHGLPTVLGTDLPCPPANIGPVSTPDYASLAAAAVQSLPGDVRAFAGQRDDPFYVDLGAIFDLLSIRPGPPGNMGGGLDGLGGFNCQTIALQLPIGSLTRDGTTPTDPNDPAAVIGVWATASRLELRVLQTNGQRPRYFGLPVQISRLGMPLVNELVIPLADKDRWNGSIPGDDNQFLGYITDPELATLLNLIYGISVPPAPRDDLVAVFLTGVAGLNQPPGVIPAEEMRLNVAIPPAPVEDRLGVLAGDQAGFPNGRRLADDVVDIALRVAAGVLVPGFDIFPNNALGDGVDRNDQPFLASFPYVGTPHHGFSHQHHLPEVPTQVELSAFDAVSDGGRVELIWSATLERDVLGFRIERNGANLTREPIPATGAREYFFVDRPDAAGMLTYSLIEVAASGVETLLAVRRIDFRPAPRSSAASLAQNRPNPFNPSTTIAFTLARDARVSLSFHDPAGRLVDRAVLGGLGPGTHEYTVNAEDWTSGSYTYSLEVDGVIQARKMLLVK